jgi:peptidoglycan/LPS O-acetylase OafA/YrhL
MNLPSGAATAHSLKPVEKPDHLPSLDGLRAISIVLVLLGHLGGTRNFRNPLAGSGDIAHFGVLIFFVISGFLITTLLLSEHAKRGSISLKLFYARRALRIFPASYAYIACVGLLSVAGVVSVSAKDLWHGATYTVNYAVLPSWSIGHLWSLSVEEQFYLLWPFSFRALGPRRAFWAAAAVMVLGPAARAGAWFFLRNTPYRDLEMFPIVADSLAVGCLLAGLRGWLEKRSWYLRLFRPAYSIAILAFVLLLNRLMPYTVVSVFGLTLINVGLAVLIHRSVYCWRDGAGSFLNWKPVAFIGVLSYSLYLWQQLFLDRHIDSWPTAFPQNLLLAVGAAMLSYLTLEKPLMKLRHRLRH